ncbi:enoyl-CoA hydratase EchA1 domain protein [Mycobacterium xenopi 4042]|uniref:Enoyl-CoA hydratase EchA19 n=1 Tax=Mycobacterium xenopi 4042 TaxID=1299334 RepID=X7ZVL9_MYCXE|nr:enoyl-CoA hydratase EchA1 domain protein [Mycobacterium xenopi 4042]
MKEPDALVEQRGHTLIVTLNRPAARNALSSEMMAIMVEAWDRIDNDPDIRCAILTGAGGYFCSGMDLKAATAKPPGDSFKDGSYDPSRIDALLKGRRLTKPLIAAVEGPAIAGGTEILQGTDIRVAGESAKFGISEAKWSLYPMGGSAVRLVRQIPYTVACDLLLTGRHITAAEAKEIGLIGYVVPDGQALAKALEIADVISANGPLAVQAILRAIRETEGLPENEAFKIDTQLGIKVFLSEDAKEGPLAFKEKRPRSSRPVTLCAERVLGRDSLRFSALSTRPMGLSVPGGTLPPWGTVFGKRSDRWRSADPPRPQKQVRRDLSGCLHSSRHRGHRRAARTRRLAVVSAARRDRRPFGFGFARRQMGRRPRTGRAAVRLSPAAQRYSHLVGSCR